MVVLPVIMDTFHCVSWLNAAVFSLLIGFLLCDFLTGSLFPSLCSSLQQRWKENLQRALFLPAKDILQVHSHSYLVFSPLSFVFLFYLKRTNQNTEMRHIMEDRDCQKWWMNSFNNHNVSQFGLWTDRKTYGGKKTKQDAVSSKWVALFIDTQKVLLHQGNKSALFSGGCHLCVSCSVRNVHKNTTYTAETTEN